MGEALRIFWRDLRRILKNPVALVVTLGVAVVPALYAWLNILSNWDPYVNTADIAVAVVNEDEGADVEGKGHISAGELVVEALRENDQIGWTFVDEDTALEGVRAGTYYAAVVMPEDFTSQLASVLDGGHDKARFVYYVNEKANAIAPKVTDTGAQTIETQIDNEFAGVVYGTVLDKVQDFMGGALSRARGDAEGLSGDLVRVRDEVDGLAAQLDEAQGLIASARTTVSEAQDALDGLSGTGQSLAEVLARAQGSLGTARSGVAALSHDLSGAVAKGSSALLDLAGTGSADVARLAAGVDSATRSLEGAITELEGLVDELAGLRDQLQEARDAVAALEPADEAGRQARERALAAIDRQAESLDALVSTARTQLSQLRGALDAARSATGGAEGLAETLATGTSRAMRGLSDATSALDAEAVPRLQESLDSFSDAAGRLSGVASQIDPALAGLSATLSQLDATLATASDALLGTKDDLARVSEQLGQVTDSLGAVQASQAWQAAEGVLGLDSDAIQSYMSAPVDVESVAVYPVDTYGSGIAPFFTNVALWVGGIALIAIYRTEVDHDDVGDFAPWQGYLGRWLLFVLVGQLQAVAVVTGDLVIGIQCLDVGALYLAASVASFVFVNIIYSLAVAFKHVGKALAFLLIIMQVPGSSGTYPIEMMPPFFQAICPWLPFTYSNNAMREAIAGYYGSYYAQNLAMLLLFVVPALVVGMGLRRALLNINHLFDEKLAETDLMLHERGGLTETHMGVEALAGALLNTEEYHDAVQEWAEDFERSYPGRVRRGLQALAVVPLALLVALFATGGALGLLVVWIVSVLAIDAYLIGVEYLHDRVRRYVSLSDMSHERLSDLIEQNLSGRMRRVVARSRARLAKAREAAATALPAPMEPGGEAAKDADAGADDDPADDAAGGAGQDCGGGRDGAGTGGEA